MGYSIVFVDGSMYRGMSSRFIGTIGFILTATAAMVLILILLISKRAIRPIAESYEKQKQFVTDVNHELKTPLTLIMTNLEILESQLGENEWIDGVRRKGEQMTELVGQLVTLSRMDEDERDYGGLQGRSRVNACWMPLLNFNRYRRNTKSIWRAMYSRMFLAWETKRRFAGSYIDPA